MLQDGIEDVGRQRVLRRLVERTVRGGARGECPTMVEIALILPREGQRVPVVVRRADEQVGERRPQADAREPGVTPVQEGTRRVHASVEALLLYDIEEDGERRTLHLRCFAQHPLQRW